MNPTGYGISRVSWLLMRISGIYLLIFFVVHVIHAMSVLDRMSWGQLLFLTYSPLGFVVLSVMIGLAAFHCLNGIRLMLNQGGIGIGTPTRPDYPYEIQSMGKKNRLDIITKLQPRCNGKEIVDFINHRNKGMEESMKVVREEMKKAIKFFSIILQFLDFY